MDMYINVSCDLYHNNLSFAIMHEYLLWKCGGMSGEVLFAKWGALALVVHSIQHRCLAPI